MEADEVASPSVRVFCSYSHADNKTFARIVEHLVSDLSAFHEAETGHKLEIFLDKEKVNWGQDFRKIIEDSVRDAAIFIPIITARYFVSRWCRDEFLSFFNKCRSLGVTDLILPIVLAGKSRLRDDSDDEVVRVIARVQYVDWTEVWPLGQGSPTWNTGVMTLVRRIAALREAVETRLMARTIDDSDSAHDGTTDENEQVERGSEFIRVVNDLGSHGKELLERAEQVINRTQTLFGKFKEGVDRVDHMDVDRRRSDYDRLGLKFARQFRELEKDAREVLEEILEFDVHWQRVTRLNRGSRDFAMRSEALRPTIETLRTSALELDELIRRVDAVFNSVEKSASLSIGLRSALSPATRLIYTIRDFAQILYGWVNIEH